MKPLIAEFLGTMLLVLLGNGVCANASLTRTKATGSANWLLINAGWALAVYVAVLCTQAVSGAHLNPAVTVGLIVARGFELGTALGYILAQLLGAMAGATLVYCYYVQHFQVTGDADTKLGCFCTAPAIREDKHNLFSEAVGTFVLVLAALLAAEPMLTLENMEGVSAQHRLGLGALGAIPVALVVFAIGAGLGGTTGYAINPARDLGPRVMHHYLPIPGKRDSDWDYAWIPVVGPVIGAVVAAVVVRMLG